MIDQEKLGIDVGSKKSYMPKEDKQLEEMEGILSFLTSKNQRRLVDIVVKASSIPGLRMVAEYLKVQNDT